MMLPVRLQYTDSKKLFLVKNFWLANLPAARRGISLKAKFILSQQAAGN
jgi:hypothetical protein